MGESTKSLLALLLIVACIATALAWHSDRPDETVWMFRVGSPIVALLSLWAILALHVRRDAVVDYLSLCASPYFNRDGFCFAILPTSSDGVAYFDAYYQNQRDQPCVGRIALRPARRFLLGRAAIDAITFQVSCEPAAFGIARMAVPVPADLQGKRISFEVGASVDYRFGKGRRVRFGDGIFLRTNSNFDNGFHTAIVLAGAATGQIVLARPAKVTMEMPPQVAEVFETAIEPEWRSLWKLGDPPLEMAHR
jgi:hypothetical protein